MKNGIVCFVLILLTGFMSGCEKIGYMVVVSTKQVSYDDLQNIGRTLEEKGFKTVIWERKKDIPKYSAEVYTLFEKKLGSKPYYIVTVHLAYVKDMPSSVVRNFKVDVRNINKGMTVDELKEEIDRTGDLIYQKLVDKVGKENVVIERKEIHHRVIFF
jgi:hypothetical protein